jgi:hypothetical protein
MEKGGFVERQSGKNYQEQLLGVIATVSRSLRHDCIKTEASNLIKDHDLAVELLVSDPINYGILDDELKRNRLVALYGVSEKGYMSTNPHNPGFCSPAEDNRWCLAKELYNDPEFLGYYDALEIVGMGLTREELMILVDKSVEFYQHLNHFPNIQIFQASENISGYVRRIDNARLTGFTK